ncbi:hypothetical protein Tco_1067984 [Tanacetum coccineum]|uniref:Reverse transcriptase domain-containing protein n=1 Tax=Tanacetum coccineum TaxID=301880 RepID=A0ABQ5HEH1_9ASTR
MIPKRRNRRRSKQIVEPELRTIIETPVATMADTRTMSELLQAPTEGYGDAIVLPPILAKNFKLKVGLLMLVTLSQFHGFEWDDPHSHIRWFNKITSTLKYKNVPHEAIKLILFPFSLEGEPGFGLKKNPLVLSIHAKISRALMKHLVRHLTDLRISYSDQDALNAAAGGNLLNRTPRDALNIIENKSKVRTSRNKPVVSKVSDTTSSSTPAYLPEITALIDAVKAMLLQNKTPSPAPVKAIEEIYVTYGGPHPYYECLATDGSTLNASAATWTYNQGGLGYRPQGETNYRLKRISDKKTKNKAKNDKTEHGMEKCEKTKSNRSQSTIDSEIMERKSVIARLNKVSSPDGDYLVIYRANGNFRAFNCLLELAITLSRLQRSVQFGTHRIASNRYVLQCVDTIRSRLLNAAAGEITALTDAVKTMLLQNKTPSPAPVKTIEEIYVTCGGLHPHYVCLATEGNTFNASIATGTYNQRDDGLKSNGDLLVTARALIDVYGEELILRVDDKAITFKVGQTSRYSYNDVVSVNQIDVSCEEYAQEVIGFLDSSKSGNPTPSLDPIITTSSPSLTPFEGGDFVLEEIEACLTSDSIPPGINDADFDPEGDIFLLEKLLNDDPSSPLPPKELNFEKLKTIKYSIDDPPELELKDLPSHLEYAFLEETNKLPVIIAKNLKDDEKSRLLKVLKSHKHAIAWKISDIKGIDP